MKRGCLGSGETIRVQGREEWAIVERGATVLDTCGTLAQTISPTSSTEEGRGLLPVALVQREVRSR
jgi:hypothetical protein